MRIIFPTLLFCMAGTLFGAETPYYILNSRANFLGDFYVAKAAFDYALAHKKNEVLGFFRHDIWRNEPLRVGTIAFEFYSDDDNNPGESKKLFEVDIPHYTEPSMGKVFHSESEILAHLAEQATKME